MKIFRKLFVVLLLVSVIFTSGCSLDFLKELPTKPANAEKPITENPVEATPTTAPTTAPTTPPTAVPTPEPTPTPTPTPVPTVAPTPKPVPPTTPSIKITKDPTDEPSVTDGREKTYFIAHAENYEQMSWEFMDANGGVMTAEDATNYYGVSISGYNEETLIIWNATWTINGWKTTRGDDIKNKDLWLLFKRYVSIIDNIGIPLSFKKVKGHSGNTFNEQADEEARRQCELAKEEGGALE